MTPEQDFKMAGLIEMMSNNILAIAERLVDLEKRVQALDGKVPPRA